MADRLARAAGATLPTRPRAAPLTPRFRRNARLQNLKVAGTSSKKDGAYRSYNGYRILTDWKREVQDEIVAASLTRDESNNIRQQIQQLKEKSATQTIEGAEGVEKALESRVQKVSSVKERLEETIDLVSAELATLGRSELKLKKVLRRKQRQLELNEERMLIRTDRPAREYTIDDVQGKLQVQNRLLSEAITKIQSCSDNVRLEHKRLEQAKGELQSDLVDKRQALEVDLTCLRLRSGGSQASAARFDISNPAPKKPTTLTQNVLSHPHKWQQSTDTSLDKALKKQEGAAALRAAIDKLLSEENHRLEEISEDVRVSLQRKLEDNASVKTDLSSKLVELETEIGDAEAQKESLKVALDEKKGPLEIGLRRHKLRQIRPSRELIHDEVEKALVHEVCAIESATASMDAKLNTVEKELLRLKQHAHAISENIRDKETAAAVDERCLNIERDDVSDTESVISVFGGQPRRSARSVSERMATLAEELDEVRVARAEVEARIDGLDLASAGAANNENAVPA